MTQILYDECPSLANVLSFRSFEESVQEATLAELDLITRKGKPMSLGKSLISLMDLLSSPYIAECPEYLAKRILRMSDYAMMIMNFSRARVFAQLANLFKLVSLRNWYRKIILDLDERSIPLESQRAPHVRLYTEIHYRTHSLHDILHVRRKVLAEWPSSYEVPQVEIKSICVYPGGSDAPLARAARINHLKYSRLNGYHYEMITEVPLAFRVNPQFYKTELIINWLESSRENQYLMLIDCDGFFTNMSIRIESVTATYQLEQETNLFVAEDSSGINTGVLVIRSCDWSRSFFRNVTQNDHMHMAWDQSMILYEILKISHVFDLEKEVAYPPSGIAFVHQGHLNAYHEGTAKSWETYAWTRGDFIKHFAGCPFEESYCASLMLETINSF